MAPHAAMAPNTLETASGAAPLPVGEGAAEPEPDGAVLDAEEPELDAVEDALLDALAVGAGAAGGARVRRAGEGAGGGRLTAVGHDGEARARGEHLRLVLRADELDLVVLARAQRDVRDREALRARVSVSSAKKSTGGACTHRVGEVDVVRDGERAVQRRVVAVDDDDVHGARVARGEGPGDGVRGVEHPAKRVRPCKRVQ